MKGCCCACTEEGTEDCRAEGVSWQWELGTDRLASDCAGAAGHRESCR